MIVGSFKAHEEDDNRHKEAVGGWDVYETLFRLGDKWFRGDIKVMITSNGRLFYGISKIKNVTEGLSGSMTTSPNDTHSVAHPGGNVNGDDRLSVTIDPEARAQAQREYDAVVAQYKGTDQWMKAPNGNATNLTERQWVQVRTPSFKKLFGDWEALAELEVMKSRVKDWMSQESINASKGKSREEILQELGNDLEAISYIDRGYI